MSFKDTSYLELRRPLSSAERNHLCNLIRGHHEKYFEFGTLVQEMFKDIS